MSDDRRGQERGYRAGEPLADIIPPDRRRLRSVALVLVGMVAGASLLYAGQEIVSRARTKAAEPQPPIIRRFTGPVEREDATSPESGRIRADGVADETFELVVEGPVLGVVIGQYDRAGQPMPNGLRWGTIEYDPAAPERASYGEPRAGTWQLAVEEHNRRLNDTGGGMKPLDSGTHRLRLTLSSAGAFKSGADVRAHVIGPGNAVTKSDPVHIAGDWPAAKRPEPAPLATGAPSDRATVSKALGDVLLDHCAKLGGAAPTGRVEITIAPEGRVTSAPVVEGIDPETPAARCVTAAFEKDARLPAFEGAPVHVKWRFRLPVPP